MMTLITTIGKSPIDEVRVSLKEYQGHTCLDVRIYTEIEGRPEKTPTKRGIMLRLAGIDPRGHRGVETGRGRGT